MFVPQSIIPSPQVSGHNPLPPGFVANNSVRHNAPWAAEQTPPTWGRPLAIVGEDLNSRNASSSRRHQTQYITPLSPKTTAGAGIYGPAGSSSAAGAYGSNTAAQRRSQYTASTSTRSQSMHESALGRENETPIPVPPRDIYAPNASATPGRMATSLPSSETFDPPARQQYYASAPIPPGVKYPDPPTASGTPGPRGIPYLPTNSSTDSPRSTTTSRRTVHQRGASLNAGTTPVTLNRGLPSGSSGGPPGRSVANSLYSRYNASNFMDQTRLAIVPSTESSPDPTTKFNTLANSSTNVRGGGGPYRPFA